MFHLTGLCCYSTISPKFNSHLNVLRHVCNGPLARYVKLRVRMRRECRERFPRHRRWAIPTCITARASRTCRDACRDRQLSVSFEIGDGGKRSRHSRRMRNLQFYVSGKRPMRISITIAGLLCGYCLHLLPLWIWVKWVMFRYSHTWLQEETEINQV